MVVDLVQCLELAFDSADLIGCLFLCSKDFRDFDREGASVRIFPFGKIVRQFDQSPAVQMTELLEGFVEQFVLCFGK